MNEAIIIPDHIYCDDLQVTLEGTDKISLLIDTEHQSLEIVLDDIGVRKLRKALEKLERKIKEKQEWPT